MNLNKEITYTGVNTRTFYQTPGGRIFKSLDELNQEYGIDATIPDFSSIAGKFIGDSEIAREELECILDIPYGPTIFEKLDVFQQ